MRVSVMAGKWLLGGRRCEAEEPIRLLFLCEAMLIVDALIRITLYIRIKWVFSSTVPHFSRTRAV